MKRWIFDNEKVNYAYFDSKLADFDSKKADFFDGKEIV
jgi:hypothetical protein